MCRIDCIAALLTFRRTLLSLLQSEIICFVPCCNNKDTTGCVGDLFYDVVGISHYLASNGRIIAH
jgi:hypothetical protein